jgi:pentatricopeptide repeat protein
MRNKVQAIVERTPIGEIDVDTWLEAELLIHWWASQRTSQSVKISFLLLERLVSEQKIHSTGNYSDLSLFLNGRIVCALVSNWQKVVKQSASTAMAVFSPQKLVLELDKLCDKSPSLQISGHGLSLIIDATLNLCKQGNTSFEAAEFCEVLWKRLVEMHYRRSNYRPDIKNFNSVLSAWATCARPDRAQAFLDRVPRDVVTPDNRSYTILLSAYAKVGDGPAAERLLEHVCRQWQLQEERLRQSKERSFGDDQSLERIRPNVVTWTTAISAWARSSSLDAPSRAEALLTRMYDPSNAPSVRPDQIVLRMVLLCWSRSSRKDGPDRCLGLLQRMKDLYATGELENPPDLFSYSIAINACGKAGKPSNAEDLFEEMYRGFVHEGHTHLKPNLQTLTLLLEAWALAGQVERAWAVLGRIRELHELGVLPTGPDLAAYNIMFSCLLNCHKDSPDCAVNADTLLQEMKKNLKTQPNIHSYACTLRAWLLTPDGLDRAVELAREALEVYSAGSKDKSITDYLSVKAIILAFCSAGHPVHAENILFEVCVLAGENRSPYPDVDVFGSLVDAWRKSEDPEAALKAENLAKKMKQLPGPSIRSKVPGRLLQKS